DDPCRGEELETTGPGHGVALPRGHDHGTCIAAVIATSPVCADGVAVLRVGCTVSGQRGSRQRVAQMGG
ncbi:MAG: hypothetical protein KGS10_15385, partial [Chloroflexi bacterium]|nr:hypothetical protein [Chloroflexota bacterium]